jgi:hypothetical protein
MSDLISGAASDIRVAAERGGSKNCDFGGDTPPLQKTNSESSREQEAELVVMLASA